MFFLSVLEIVFCLQKLFYASCEKPPGSSRTVNAVESIPIKLLHERMGHMDWNAAKRLLHENPPMIGVRLDATPEPQDSCAGCQAGKGKRREFKSSTSRNKATRPLERIHTDLTGPMKVNSLQGERFGCVFTDDYTRHVWFYPLKKKSQTLRTFMNFRALVENQTGRKITFF